MVWEAILLVYIKHEKERFICYPNTLKLNKKWLPLIFYFQSTSQVKALFLDLLILRFYGDRTRFFKYKEPVYVFSNFSVGSYRLYFEIKFPKNELERLALHNRVRIRKGKISMYFSPIELQIAYKLWLGSDKDVLDAAYLYNLFKDALDVNELKRLAFLLGVEKELEKLLK